MLAEFTKKEDKSWSLIKIDNIKQLKEREKLYKSKEFDIHKWANMLVRQFLVLDTDY